MNNNTNDCKNNAARVINMINTVLNLCCLKKTGGAYSRGGAYLKIWLIQGARIRRGAYSRGGANSRIYGIYNVILKLQENIINQCLKEGQIVVCSNPFWRRKSGNLKKLATFFNSFKPSPSMTRGKIVEQKGEKDCVALVTIKK